MRHIPMISGDEMDAFTRAQHFMHWRNGERSRIKRGFRRRERRALNQNLWDFEDNEYHAAVHMCCQQCADEVFDFRPGWLRKD